jgi:ABC-type hemin transport system substrate-binding protein
MAEYDDLTEAMERAKARQDEVKELIVAMANGRNASIAGRNVTKVEKAGSVSYAKAIAKYAPNADLEPFRGKPSSYWKVG